MRTTLTIEPDVAARLKAVMRRRGLTLKAAINDALRRGLALVQDEPPPPPFRVRPHDCGGFVPGVDPAKLGQLGDELEAHDFARGAR